MQDNIWMYAGNGTEKQADHVSGKWSIASEFLKESGTAVSKFTYDPSAWGKII